MADNPRLQAALDYIRRGWPVFPLHNPVKSKTGNVCSCGKTNCNPAKHPRTIHGAKDATTDPKQIQEWWAKWPDANVGIVTGEASGLVVVDIDPRHGGADSLKAIKKLGNLPLTPSVLTGGGGEHIYLAHPGNGTKIKCMAQLGGYPGIDLKADGGSIIAPPSRHISGGTYAWKHHHLKNRIAAIPAWMREHLLQDFAPPRGQVHIDILSFPLEGGETRIAEGTRDNTLFEIAKSLKQGGMERSEVERVILLLAKYCCDPEMPRNAALEKVASTFTIHRNFSQEIREWLSFQKGFISVSECDHELQGVTGVSDRFKQNRRLVFHRLVNEGILERIENKPGIYRIVETDLDPIDFLGAIDEDALPIKWPLGIENLVDILPKNIAIVAGSKDAGKTVFCLNTILMNQNKFQMVYFSSEMAAQELRKRLRKFDVPLDAWKFQAYNRASRFADAVVPDAFNIIDYLEITKDFSLIAEEIRQIYDKLTTGIALIAIQKDPDAAMGRGKSFSIEKARLYLTLDRTTYGNTCTIVSGKNWHQDGYNPAGVVIKYKIVNGAKIIEYD